MSNYPRLFSPLAIRGLRFPNRIVRASLATELCEADGSVTEAFLTYYAKHAAGGAGLVMTELRASMRSRAGRFRVSSDATAIDLSPGSLS